MSHDMSMFLPRTEIVFCDTGIDDYNKPYFTSNAAMYSWCNSKALGRMLNASFQRDQGGQYIRVDHSDIEYYVLMGCDTVLWINPQDTSPRPRWMCGHIISVEWKNPNTSYVYYEIDWYTSFVDCIDWANCVSFIEREHVSKDNQGGVPDFSLCGVPEGSSLDNDYLMQDHKLTYLDGSNTTYEVLSPYDENGEPIFGDSSDVPIYNGLSQVKTSKGGVTTFLNNLAKHNPADVNQVVAIYSHPSQLQNTLKNLYTYTFTPGWKTYPGRYNNAKCWSGDYYTIKCYSLLGDKIVNFRPEDIANSYEEISFKIDGRFVKGMTLVYMYCNTIRFRDNNEHKVIITKSPQGQWVSNEFAQWNAMNFLHNIFTMGNAVKSFASIPFSGSNSIDKVLDRSKNTSDYGTAMGVVNEIQGKAIAGEQSIVGLAQSFLESKTYGASVKGGGNLDTNTAYMYEGFDFHICEYCTNPIYLKSIDQYFDRYGYKVNALRNVNPLRRPRWYFIKTTDAHCTDKGGEFNIPYNAVKAIESLWNAGITIFRTDLGIAIGDLSNAEANAGTGVD